ncbi:hypothetical protein FRC05_000877 [Tulasnella sp. 425]|nr:hypothetical protein FRC05_000877 [Tulasnella sp. 425]
MAHRPIVIHEGQGPRIRRGLVVGVASDERARARIPVEIAPVARPLNRADDVRGFIFWDLRGKNRRDEELGRETIQPVTNAAGSAIDFGGSLVNNLTPYFDFDISSTIKVAERDAAVAGTPVQWITSISKSALEKNEDGSF